jgi:hypothetical protein
MAEEVLARHDCSEVIFPAKYENNIAPKFLLASKLAVYLLSYPNTRIQNGQFVEEMLSKIRPKKKERLKYRIGTRLLGWLRRY